MSAAASGIIMRSAQGSRRPANRLHRTSNPKVPPSARQSTFSFRHCSERVLWGWQQWNDGGMDSEAMALIICFASIGTCIAFYGVYAPPNSQSVSSQRVLHRGAGLMRTWQRTRCSRRLSSARYLLERLEKECTSCSRRHAFVRCFDREAQRNSIPTESRLYYSVSDAPYAAQVDSERLLRRPAYVPLPASRPDPIPRSACTPRIRENLLMTRPA